MLRKSFIHAASAPSAHSGEKSSKKNTSSVIGEAKLLVDFNGEDRGRGGKKLTDTSGGVESGLSGIVPRMYY